MILRDTIHFFKKSKKFLKSEITHPLWEVWPLFIQVISVSRFFVLSYEIPPQMAPVQCCFLFIRHRNLPFGRFGTCHRTEMYL